MAKKTRAGMVFLTTLMLLLLSASMTVAGGPTADVYVEVDGTAFYQDGTEAPLARLHDAYIYPCGGGDPVYYYVWTGGGHVDEETWVDMGFPIDYIVYSWHEGEAGVDQYYDIAYGSCGMSWKYTGRIAHQYRGQTWWCTLVSEVGVPEDSPRFWNPQYVDDTCGNHEIYGDFVLAGDIDDQVICKEKKWANGDLGCGNHYLDPGN